jgi:uncharacterized OB-fold protein
VGIPVKACTNCQSILYASKTLCQKCFSDDLESREISGRGEIYSYTQIYVAPKQLEHEPPYYVVLVQLEKDLKVTGRFNGEGVHIGKSVDLDENRNQCFYFKSM